MKDYYLTGNEALAYGTYEAGVRVATGYPGSPVTRFLEYLVDVSAREEMYVEWSANEKVAFEVALGASMGGSRSTVCFKCVGLNVAMDPLMVANLAGVVGGFTIVLGDDPGAWFSQNEQDGRTLARAAEVPILEFSSPQEAYDMSRYAYDLSERFEIPVLIRETRASSIERGKVKAEGKRVEKPPIPFSEATTWKNLPIRQLDKHIELQAKLPKITEEFNASPFNKMLVEGPKGVIGSGYTAATVSRLLSEVQEESLSFFKLGTVYPPPEKPLQKFLSSLKAVLVAEEVQPLVEQYTRSLAHRNGLSVQVYGRETGHLPRVGRIFKRHLLEGIKRSLGIELHVSISKEEGLRPKSPLEAELPPECPYYQAFEAFSAALRDDPEERPIFIGDEGCLMRLKNEPFKMFDSKFCMGASIGMAEGLVKGGERRRVVALMGDSSFFHSGVSAYMDAVANDADIVIIIIDNYTTAMTGCQSNPGSGMDARGEDRVRVHLENILSVSVLKNFYVLDAFGDKEELASAFKQCLESQGLAVMLIQGACVNLMRPGSCP